LFRPLRAPEICEYLPSDTSLLNLPSVLADVQQQTFVRTVQVWILQIMTRANQLTSPYLSLRHPAVRSRPSCLVTKNKNYDRNEYKHSCRRIRSEIYVTAKSFLASFQAVISYSLQKLLSVMYLLNGVSFVLLKSLQ
jgi:hypothetical protein